MLTVREMERQARNFGSTQTWVFEGVRVQAVPEYSGDHNRTVCRVVFKVNGWVEHPDRVAKLLTERQSADFSGVFAVYVSDGGNAD